MEPIIFVLCVYAVGALALARMAFVSVRDSARERRLSEYSRELLGQRRETATELFGEPYAVHSGRDRTLIEWKSPPSEHFPKGSGLAIFYIVVNANGRIVEASWQTRSEGKWKAGGEPRRDTAQPSHTITAAAPARADERR